MILFEKTNKQNQKQKQKQYKTKLQQIHRIMWKLNKNKVLQK